MLFERWTGTAWTAAMPSDRVCAEVLYLLDSNAAHEYPFMMPAGTPSGTYRLAIECGRDGSAQTARVNSNEFDLQ